MSYLHLLNVPLGVPMHSQDSKCIIDPGTAMIVLGGLGALTGIGNVFSQSSSNATNLQAVREQNQANREMLWAQQAFSKRMWNLNNEYNDPVNQRKRFEEAGINPYMALTQMDAGNAEMAVSPSAQPMQSGHVQPLDFSGISSGIGSGVSAAVALQQSDAINLDNASKRISLMYKTANEIEDLQAKIADNAKRGIDVSTARENLNYLRKRMDFLLQSDEASAKLLGAQYDTEIKKQAQIEAQSQYTQKQTEYQELFNKAFPARNRAELARLAAECKSDYANAYAATKSGELSEKKAATEATNNMVARANKYGLDIDNSYKGALYRQNLRNLRAQNAQSKAVTENVKSNTYKTDHTSNVGPFTFSRGKGKYGAWTPDYPISPK